MGEWWAEGCEYRLIIRCTAGTMKFFTTYIDFGMSARPVQECYCARLCHRAKSHLVSKTTNTLKSGWKLLSMAAGIGWTMHWNKCQQSVNDLLFCKYCNSTVIWLLLYIIKVLAAYIGTIRSSCSLPHIDDESPHSVKDLWSCVLGNHTADRLQSVI